jgi:hypothetical protein
LNYSQARPGSFISAASRSWHSGSYASTLHQSMTSPTRSRSGFQRPRLKPAPPAIRSIHSGVLLVSISITFHRDLCGTMRPVRRSVGKWNINTLQLYHEKLMTCGEVWVRIPVSQPISPSLLSVFPNLNPGIIPYPPDIFPWRKKGSTFPRPFG